MNVNEKALDFHLEDKDGNLHALSDFLGKKIVLYFYPKDNTPGCTKQACAFKEAYKDFIRQDVVVIGISKDPKKSHQKFIDKYELPFLLLSDEKLEAIEAYGVWVEKKLYGRVYMGVQRSTFVIDEKGIIIKKYDKASPDKNANEILEFLSEI